MKPSDQMPLTWWLTGLPAAGKSTLAAGLQDKFLGLGKPFVVLDGDVLRRGVCSDLGFSAEDRDENVRRVAEMARVLNDQGISVAVALVSPLRDARENARRIIGADRFIEVFVSTPLAVCSQRDPKGLYAQASQNSAMQFTGVSAQYDIPEKPDVAIDTSNTELAVAIQTLVTVAEKKQKEIVYE